MEEWQPIPIEPFNRFYQVSNMGRIKGRDILNPARQTDGYMRVKLKYKGVKRDYYVHRLVAMVYVENPEGKTKVRHIDSDRGNNRADNLEWW